ncbi:MAG TPA: GAF domain-containing protein [Candidatus Sulfomarinibacteraceae bacterium]|nr:GAF domain-containing protein [Candidatus Sulfomarinibacteraceae bacterium]
MRTLFRRIWTAPGSVYSREDDASAAQLLNATLLVIGLVAPLVTITLSLLQGTGLFSLSSAIGLFVAVAMLVLRAFLVRGFLVTVSWLTSAILLATITGTLFVFNGVRDSNTVALIVVIVVASLLLRERRSIVLITLGAVVGLIVVYTGELAGLVTYEPRPLDPTYAITYVIAFALVGLLLDIAINNLNQALGRARASERELASANEELESLNQELEARVAARTRALELSADVSRRLSTILDQEELVHTVVDQLQEAFDYYHVHIYVLDEDSSRLQMVGGTGEAGRRMLQRGHTIPVGKGLVGRAAETAVPIVVPDVSREPGWLPNELLPETRSEIAVPIMRRGQVLGVLDVQDNEVGGLTTENAELLQSISNQVAVALQNARLFAEAERRAQREALLGDIAQQIQSTTDVDSALQVAVRELGRALERKQTAVRLMTPLVEAGTGGHGGSGDGPQ